MVLACGLVHVEAWAQATRVEASGDAITFQGRIDAAAAARFIQLAKDPAIKRVVITSHGGLVAPALDMADTIRQRGLDVDVPATCFSSCANYIFPAGKHKRLGHARAIGWHGNMMHVLWLAQAGRERWSEPLMDDARMLAQRETDFYRALGVDGYVCWFAKLAPYEVPGFYTLTPEDMGRFGIADVSVDAAAIEPDDAPDIVNVDWQRLAVDRPAVLIGP